GHRQKEVVVFIGVAVPAVEPPSELLRKIFAPRFRQQPTVVGHSPVPFSPRLSSRTRLCGEAEHRVGRAVKPIYRGRACRPSMLPAHVTETGERTRRQTATRQTARDRPSGSGRELQPCEPPSISSALSSLVRLSLGMKLIGRNA